MTDLLERAAYAVAIRLTARRVRLARYGFGGAAWLGR